MTYLPAFDPAKIGIATAPTGDTPRFCPTMVFVVRVVGFKLNKLVPPFPCQMEYVYGELIVSMEPVLLPFPGRVVEVTPSVFGLIKFTMFVVPSKRMTLVPAFVPSKIVNALDHWPIAVEVSPVPAEKVFVDGSKTVVAVVPVPAVK